MPEADELGLGQGLREVLARTPRRTNERNGQMGNEVEIGLIRPPGANPRTRFDEATLEELASSIRQHGMLQPIVVMRKEGGGYEIVAGERRWRAAKKLGLEKVPVVVREDDGPRHLAELRLVENIQRENLNPIELALAYRSLQDEHGLSHEELAVRLGKDRTSIANTTRLLQLPKVVCDDVAAGRLSMGHAKALLSLPDAPAITEVAQRAIEEGWSVRETERQCRLWGRATRGQSKNVTPAIRELEANLFRLLGAPVAIKEGGGGKGAVTVKFQSKQQFQRIIEVFDRVCKEAARNPEGPASGG
ncbi:MAG: ParB/RepB/Spo0J family partition protein [Planctomycetota bacterium]|nr:MAG: ParB/RepB/Spo0J family partition protein [Planctomycetota bacterium]